MRSLICYGASFDFVDVVGMAGGFRLLLSDCRGAVASVCSSGSPAILDD